MSVFKLANHPLNNLLMLSRTGKLDQNSIDTIKTMQAESMAYIEHKLIALKSISRAFEVALADDDIGSFDPKADGFIVSNFITSQLEELESAIFIHAGSVDALDAQRGNDEHAN